MRLLILATTKFAPTYNEKLISQINYFNSFDNMKADIFIDDKLYWKPTFFSFVVK